MPRSQDSHTPPMPSIAVQAETATPPPQETFPRTDTLDVEVMMYAIDEGRNLSGTHARVLEALARYSDVRHPERRGLVWPSQDTLAEALEMARGTVCRILADWEAVGVIESTTRTDLEGFHKQYQFVAANHGWRPLLGTSLERRSPATIIREFWDAERVRSAEKDLRIEELERQLAAALEGSPVSAGMTAGPVGQQMSSPVTGVGGGGYLNNIDNNHHHRRSSVTEDDTRSGQPQSTPRSEGVSEPGPASVTQDDIQPKDLESTTDQSSEEINAWVDENWNHLRQSPENPRGWKFIEKAVEWYIGNPRAFRQQRDDLAARLTAGMTPSLKPMTAHERRIAAEKRIPLRDVEVI